MASQRGTVLKRNYFFAFLILLIGFGGLLGYDLYFKPYILSQTVVKVKAGAGGYLPRNYVLQPGDLYLDSVQTKDVPSDAVTELSRAEYKMTNTDLTDGSILTGALVDVSDLAPRQDEGIFPIPQEAIYAINGSLRSKDRVDIYLVEGESRDNHAAGYSTVAASGMGLDGKGGAPGIAATSSAPLSPDPAGSDVAPGLNGSQAAGPAASNPAVISPAGTETVPPEDSRSNLFLSGVTVNYVRSEDNNDVLDSENGNNNNRITSTGKVAAPELKLKKSEGEQLGQYLEQGMKLWIVRVQ
ncbi:hypothetical protein [Paenibacillus tepidiphilus]|uniref:hypothetical protein n=1 Tax=Paenibacillus tepidiphilus TaxID=2608683 RepID=UPI00123C671B|nr:hypothetical protein [Paenibacillus tepidiphilus]